MVAESEWGDLQKIEEDFQKLLLARSAVRVMVYDSKYANVNQLCEYINSFNGAQGDTYLLAAWVDEDERLFEFSEVVYQGPDNLPTLKTL